MFACFQVSHITIALTFRYTAMATLSIEQYSIAFFSFAKWAGNLKDEIFPDLNTSAAEQVFVTLFIVFDHRGMFLA